MDNLKYWVWLVQCFGTGNNRLWEIASSYDCNAEITFQALKSGKYTYLSENEKKSVERTHISASEEMIELCKKKGYNIVSFDDISYPERLKNIYNPPAVLFCMGDIGFINNEITITVVGTRKPSEYSLKFAKRICDEMAKTGVTLVSGFALGIDSMAHQAALKNNGRTVAVLGSGLDVAYPKENADLKKIIAVNGAVVTEFFPGTQPSGKNFPQRNRILSGLSLGTLVVEAAVGSGALITADFAINQGRDVFCVPPADLFDARYAGVIRLIREGAIPTFSHLDIMFEYYENFSHKLISTNPFNDYSGDENIVFNNRHKTSKPASEETKTEDAKAPDEIDYSSLSQDEARIVKLLEKGDSLLCDEIAALTGMEVSDVLTTLTELELSGILTAKAGQRYSL